MAFNFEFPYTDSKRYNDDWLLATVKQVVEQLKEFINLNTIKYANPISWNITSQYEANTVVVDAQTGNAYISVQPVPAGVQINNTEYWCQIYNYASVIDTLREQIAYDEGSSTTATRAYAINDLVFVNGLLYKVIAPMIAGDSFVVDSNIEKVTIMSVINAFISGLANEIIAREDADTALGGRIDDEITAREDADTALGGRIDDEITAREDADTALSDRIDAIDLTMLLQPSGDTSGATDTAAINAAIAANNYVLLDKGDYYINSAILVKAGTTILGVGNNLTKIHVTSDISAITPATPTTSVDNLTIKNLYLLGVEPTNSTHYAIDLNFVYDGEHYYGARYSLFENLDIRYFYGGFRGSQFWDTTFIKCRFASANTDVRLRDAVNNVTFIQCVFNPDKYTWDSVGEVPTGAGVVADNGERVECYNISFYNCDAESRNICYKMTTVVACGFYNCYTERVNEVFNFDSCPASIVIGGNINGCNKIARVAATYSSDTYNGLVTFKDLFVRVNETDTDNVYIVPTSAAGKVYVDNINIHNSGSGKCYLVANDNTTFRTGQANAIVVKELCDLEGIRYSSEEYRAYLTNIGVTQTFKLQGINAIVKKTFTTTTATKLQLYRGSGLMLEVSIPAGTHNAGEVLTADVGSVILINTNDFKFTLSATVEVEMNIIGVIRGYIIEDGQNTIGTVPTINL